MKTEFESKELASMDAEIGAGCPKEKSRFKDRPEFSETWDRLVSGRKEITDKYPHAKFDIPNEFPDFMG